MFGLNRVVEYTSVSMAAHKVPRVLLSRSLSKHLQYRGTPCKDGQSDKTRYTLVPRSTRPSACSAGQNTLSPGASATALRRYSTWDDLSCTKSSFAAEDLQFLNSLVLPNDNQRLSAASMKQIGEFTPFPGEMFFGAREASRSVMDSSNIREGFSASTGNLNRLFRGVLDAMQQRNSQKLLICLEKITNLPHQELVEAVTTLPRTTFSEVLRCLDPVQIGRENDPTRGVTIGAGAWQILNLGAVIDEWGIRKLYTKLLKQMLILMRALHTSGQPLNVNDYGPLFRAAGLTSDMSVAKLLWDQMVKHDIDYWRNSAAHDEFIKARFLIEPAYSGYDKRHLMMTPRNLHRRGGMYLRASVSRLDNLRKNLRKTNFKFGLNKNVGHVEELSRVLRKPLPPTRLFFHMQMYGVHMSEKALCQLMIAFARAGSLRFIQYRILEDYFGIAVSKDSRNGRVVVQTMSPRTKPRKDPFRPALPTHFPTAKVVDAIVYTYCSNAQLSTAFHIVDFIANKYRIPISQKVWFELLEWSYVLSTPPTSTAWRVAGLVDRIPSIESTEIIWNIMTAPPYNVQPGFKQYDIFIRALLRLQRYEEAIKHMRDARKLYDKQCLHFEVATFEYASAKSAGIPSTKEAQAFQRARFLKEYMRHRMNGWCNNFLEKKPSPADLHDPMATRRIPDFIKEWRDILSNPVRYRTSTGFVHLLDPAVVFEKTVHVQDHIVDLPVKRQGRWRLIPLAQKQFRLISKHTLGDLMSTRVDPLDILKGVVPELRPTKSRRVDKWRAWKKGHDAERQAVLASVAEHDITAEGQTAEDLAPEQDIWDDDDY